MAQNLNQSHFNVTHAETISAPTDAFYTEFSHILDGVASDRTFIKKLTPPLQAALKWPTDTISTYDLEKAIWDDHWKLHILARKDPDPRKDKSRLKPGAQKGSSDAQNYHFGLLEEDISEYVRLADLFHGLMLFRYGNSRLYPYLMTRVEH